MDGCRPDRASPGTSLSVGSHEPPMPGCHLEESSVRAAARSRLVSLELRRRRAASSPKSSPTAYQRRPPDLEIHSLRQAGSSSAPDQARHRPARAPDLPHFAALRHYTCPAMEAVFVLLLRVAVDFIDVVVHFQCGLVCITK